MTTSRNVNKNGYDSLVLVLPSRSYGRSPIPCTCTWLSTCEITSFHVVSQKKRRWYSQEHGADAMAWWQAGRENTAHSLANLRVLSVMFLLLTTRKHAAPHLKLHCRPPILYKAHSTLDIRLAHSNFSASEASAPCKYHVGCWKASRIHSWIQATGFT